MPHRLHHAGRAQEAAGTDVMIFTRFSPKELAKNLVFSLKTAKLHRLRLDRTNIFYKTDNFVAKIRLKSVKLVFITLAPGHRQVHWHRPPLDRHSDLDRQP
jgi:hypothetical protein